jgi:hypothetical protein
VADRQYALPLPELHEQRRRTDADIVKNLPPLNIMTKRRLKFLLGKRQGARANLLIKRGLRNGTLKPGRG